MMKEHDGTDSKNVELCREFFFCGGQDAFPQPQDQCVSRRLFPSHKISVYLVGHTARIIEGGLKMVGTDIIIVGYHSVGWPFWKIEAAGALT
jgi:hypothetical protein